ncbi:TolC family protein [Venenivibrio stagnispumantis]|uniref:Outer membrane protein TolC n=1 Tax=Venenivibrio stagnispumantis TaxID=407998 RepID=A0AA45WJV5_9AQUI|nr:TolC family protein [Venenivibrio stagnispumantis]MCW4572922.1 TolC family protein [Venenivibrio stagnispumantis]SMP04633.1 Outer membrane protein TolC [Venenivibrio stagnispumantis]
MKRLFITALIINLSYASTYEEVIQLATQRATDIKLSEEDIKKIEYQIKEAKSNLYPSLSITGSYTRWDPNYISGFTPKNQYNAKLTLSQTIFDQSIFETLNIAKKSLKLQNATKENVKINVIDTARRLYYDALYKKSVLKQKEENLKYWQENLKLVENKYQVGQVAKYDYMTAKAQYQSAISDLELAKANYEKSIIELKRFLFKEDLTPPEGELSKIDYNLDEDFDKLLEENPDIKVLKEQIAVQDSQIKLEEVANNPTVSFQANYQTNNIMKFPQNEEAWKKGYNFNISANMVIFDGFKKDSRVMQAKIDKTKYNIQLEDKKNSVKAQIKEALQDLNALQKQIDANKANLEASEEALRLSTERYKVGVANIVELLQSKSNYETAKLNYLTSIYSYNLRLFDLMKLIGK